MRRKLLIFCKRRLLVIDERYYLPMDWRQTNLLFQLILARYEKGSIILTSDKTYPEWTYFSFDDGIDSISNPP
ncbi:MAG: ATP-binding protein [Calditrichia bacterium]